MKKFSIILLLLSILNSQIREEIIERHSNGETKTLVRFEIIKLDTSRFVEKEKERLEYSPQKKILQHWYFDGYDKDGYLEQWRIIGSNITTFYQVITRSENGDVIVQKLTYDNTLEDTLLFTKTTTFDSLSRSKVETYYNSDGSLDYEKRLSYPEEGIIIKKWFDETGDMYLKWKEIYNSENLLRVNYHYNSRNKLRTYTEFEYDTHGNEINESRFDSLGRFLGETVIDYDEIGNKTESLFYDSQRKLTSNTRYDHTSGKSVNLKYNEYGKVYEEIYFNEYDEITKVVQYEYDERGRLIRRKEL